MGEDDQVRPPSREETRQVLVDLLHGNITREEADEWAGQWVYFNITPVDDMVVWNALLHLAGADLTGVGGIYLHNEEGFQSWLDEFDASCKPPPT
jgi:hypothetical protein